MLCRFWTTSPALLLLCSDAAHGYVGPLIIVGALGGMFGWVAAVVIAVVLVISYPVYLMRRRKYKRKQGKDSPP